MALLNGQIQMGSFCLLMDAPYVVFTTRKEVDCNLLGVYQEVVVLARGRSVIKGASLDS